jgi:protein-tyrosine-phosphatase
MAEAIARHIGGHQLEVYSAGSDPLPAVNPQVIHTLEHNQVPAGELTPKDLRTFEGQPFDFVICLCDRDHEAATLIPGADVARWNFPDPLDHEDEGVRARALEAAFHALEQRIRLLMAVTSPRPEPVHHGEASPAT